MQIKMCSGVNVYKSYVHSGVALLYQGLLLFFLKCLFSLAIISSCAKYSFLMLTVLEATHCSLAIINNKTEEEQMETL